MHGRKRITRAGMLMPIILPSGVSFKGPPLARGSDIHEARGIPRVPVPDLPNLVPCLRLQSPAFYHFAPSFSSDPLPSCWVVVKAEAGEGRGKARQVGFDERQSLSLVVFTHRFLLYSSAFN